METITNRQATIERLASGLFFEIASVDALASYLVRTHADPRCAAMSLMDDLAKAVLMAPLDMTLTHFRNVATPQAVSFRSVLVISPFVGHTTCMPLQYAIDHRMDNLLLAINAMLVAEAEELPTRYYANARMADVRGELIFESFTAKRELAELAWPTLLLALCYRHFAMMLLDALHLRVIDASFAADIIKASTETLAALVDNGWARYTDLRRLQLLRVVSSDDLMTELTRLLAIMRGLDLGRMIHDLERFVAELSARCAPASLDDYALPM